MYTIVYKIIILHYILIYMDYKLHKSLLLLINTSNQYTFYLNT